LVLERQLPAINIKEAFFIVKCYDKILISTYVKRRMAMRPRFIILTIIAALIFSGCSTVNKKSAENNNSTYILEGKAAINDKVVEANDTIKEDSQDPLVPKDPSPDQASPVPYKKVVSQASSVKEDVKAAETKGISINTKLFDYLSVAGNRNSVAERANELHGGNLHNSCVYYASEALRRIGIKIPDSMSLIPPFIKELKKQGFKTSYNLKDLKPGDICFTTDVKGVIGGRPTHTYIFMGWESPGVAKIVDNQLYDYGDVYHIRHLDFYYLNNQKDKPKEATAFFMYK
jgi:hypothetical protein